MELLARPNRYDVGLENLPFTFFEHLAARVDPAVRRGDTASVAQERSSVIGGRMLSRVVEVVDGHSSEVELALTAHKVFVDFQTELGRQTCESRLVADAEPCHCLTGRLRGHCTRKR